MKCAVRRVDDSMVSSRATSTVPQAPGSRGCLDSRNLVPLECRAALSTNSSIHSRSMNAADTKPLTCTCDTDTIRKQRPANSKKLPPEYPHRLRVPSPHPQTQTSASICRNFNIYVVGAVGHPKASVVRVVHISDTRGVSDFYSDQIPNGHILVHSGDFLSGPPRRSSKLINPRGRCPDFKKIRRLSKSEHPVAPASDAWKAKLKTIDDFFRGQPHPFKIFVPGCWDYFGATAEGGPSPSEIQKHLPSAIYLEDSWCQVLGLRIHGVPWTSADDLRPEDGKSDLVPNNNASRLSFSSLFKKSSTIRYGSQRRYRCFSSCTGDTSTSATVGIGACSLSNKLACHISDISVRDGFILPDIEAVSQHYKTIPQETDILISHMPAWRQELYSQVVERIQPMLHLCGHDFSGYGVTWRRGVVFSNAALQLTGSYPPVHRRRKAYSSSACTTASITGGAPTTIAPVAGASAPAAPSASTVGSDSQVIFDLPAGFREPRLLLLGQEGCHRPRRWRRRLSSLLSRVSVMVSRSLDGLLPSRSSGIGLGPLTGARVKQTPSSLAALNVPQQVADEGFVYDPSMSASGSGLLASCSIGRRSAAVFDVYVVIDDDRVILPDYLSGERRPPVYHSFSSMGSLHSEQISCRPVADPVLNRTTCSVQ